MKGQVQTVTGTGRFHQIRDRDPTGCRVANIVNGQCNQIGQVIKKYMHVHSQIGVKQADSGQRSMPAGLIN